MVVIGPFPVCVNCTVSRLRKSSPRTEAATVQFFVCTRPSTYSPMSRWRADVFANPLGKLILDWSFIIRRANIISIDAGNDHQPGAKGFGPLHRSAELLHGYLLQASEKFALLAGGLLTKRSAGNVPGYRILVQKIRPAVSVVQSVPPVYLHRRVRFFCRGVPLPRASFSTLPRR